MTLEQFKKGIAKHSKILQRHGLIDPADRQDKGFKRHTKTKPAEEKAVKPDLLDELFAE